MKILIGFFTKGAIIWETLTVIAHNVASGEDIVAEFHVMRFVADLRMCRLTMDFPVYCLGNAFSHRSIVAWLLVDGDDGPRHEWLV